MQGTHPGRRRIDRITADNYLKDLQARSSQEVRAMRDDCREEETHLSYTRRVLQGRVDIARAEAARRSGDQPGDLLDALPKILADAPAPRRAGGRSTPIYQPGEGRRQDDEVFDESALGRLPDLSDEELAAVTKRLAEQEQRVSALRGRVLNALDTLQAELIRRYREESPPVDDILSEHGAGDDAPAGSSSGS